MKIQFKVQPYQTAAVDAVADCFAGQPRREGLTYRIDPGRRPDGPQAEMFEDIDGFPNAPLEIDRRVILDNVRGVQRRSGIVESDKLVETPPCDLNLDIEMETGTGKTYCYIKTMFELHRRYGWNKFIVVVPSVAIREGVHQSLAITADHFQQTYGRRVRFFTYDSKQLHELESFSSDAGINVMVINVQAFNAFKPDAKNKAARIMFDARDDFQSRRPIDVLRKNRPILILDEPQRMGGAATTKALREFDPMLMLRYSATHRDTHNRVYRLDALDAYQQKLVKRIAVRGITVKGLTGTDGYLYLENIRLSKTKPPEGVLDMERKTAGGVKRFRKIVTKGTDLHVASHGLDQYRGYVVSDIDFRGVEGYGRGFVEFTNGVRLTVGTAAGDVNEDTLRRLQIRESIKAHFDKEAELFARGIKCLTLFFIDTVAKYRDYEREDSRGDYARYFEEEYKRIREEYRTLLAEDAAYQEYLDGIPAADTHEGYFSVDKKTKRLKDPKVAARGETAGETDDVDAYDLILRSKETLLSFPDATDDTDVRRRKNVRFIFSHSALREGWDNPNVFTIGMLKKADYEGSSQTTRRQEVGRGLRLCVDADGRRIDDPATVHDVNVLTVVANEGFDEFVGKLQGEMRAALGDRPRTADEKYFLGKLLVRDFDDAPATEDTEAATPAAGTTERTVDDRTARMIHQYLVKNDYVDVDNRITATYTDARRDGTVADLPPELSDWSGPVLNLVDSVYDDSKLPTPEDGRRPRGNPVNRANLAKKEFQELWNRINRKAVYAVDFETDELVRNCIRNLNEHLHVAGLTYRVDRGIQKATHDADDLRQGRAIEVRENTTDRVNAPVVTDVRYDLIGKLATATDLTRKTIAAILTGILPTTFEGYRKSPEQFLSRAARIINEQKATVIVEHLTYDPLDGEHHSDIFTTDQRADISKAFPAERHVFEYVITDSQTERRFVETLDRSTEVCVYAKLPRAFTIPTPVGNYNPDWAIAFHRDSVRHVYFVAETKGSMSSLELREIEKSKIACARKFFAKISTDRVKYEQIDGYDKLMEVVGGAAASGE